MIEDFNGFFEEFELYCKSFPYSISLDGFGFMSHPLFFHNIFIDENGNSKSITSQNYNEVINNVLERFKTEARRKHHKNKFEFVLALVNKPYRLEVFLMFQHLLNEEDYNAMLKWVWIMTEFPHQISFTRLNLLFKKINKKLFMSEEELEFYKKLPQKVKIYRGLQGPKAKVKALSWTFDKEKAIWFANRFKNNGKVYEMIIDKKEIYAYINSRGEEEIIINPYMVKNFVLLLS